MSPLGDALMAGGELRVAGCDDDDVGSGVTGFAPSRAFFVIAGGSGVLIARAGDDDDGGVLIARADGGVERGEVDTDGVGCDDAAFPVPRPPSPVSIRKADSTNATSIGN